MHKETCNRSNKVTTLQHQGIGLCPPHLSMHARVGSHCRPANSTRKLRFSSINRLGSAHHVREENTCACRPAESSRKSRVLSTMSGLCPIFWLMHAFNDLRSHQENHDSRQAPINCMHIHSSRGRVLAQSTLAFKVKKATVGCPSHFADY